MCYLKKKTVIFDKSRDFSCDDKFENFLKLSSFQHFSALQASTGREQAPLYRAPWHKLLTIVHSFTRFLPAITNPIRMLSSNPYHELFQRNQINL